MECTIFYSGQNRVAPHVKQTPYTVAAGVCSWATLVIVIDPGLIQVEWLMTESTVPSLSLPKSQSLLILTYPDLFCPALRFRDQTLRT